MQASFMPCFIRRESLLVPSEEGVQPLPNTVRQAGEFRQAPCAPQLVPCPIPIPAGTAGTLPPVPHPLASRRTRPHRRTGVEVSVGLHACMHERV